MQTIHAQHIEPPEKPFTVEFQQSGYFNVFYHPPKRRTVKILAQSNYGALKIAEYHFFISGNNFKLKKRKEIKAMDNKKVITPKSADGKWFCVECSQPINNGFSYRGRCVVCAEKFLNEEHPEYPIYGD